MGYYDYPFTSWSTLRPHQQQSIAWRSQAKTVALLAGRGSGKTEIAKRRALRELCIDRPDVPEINLAYVLPTFNQAKRSAWRSLKALIPDRWRREKLVAISESELTITFVPTGATLYVVGADKPYRIEGSQYVFVVIDEASDQKPGIYTQTVAPATTHYNGKVWCIGVPKRTGIGRKWYKKFCQDAELFLTWRSETVLSKEQLVVARTNMSGDEYDEQMGAEWLEVGGQIFYAFTADNINDEHATYNSDLRIFVGQDFNVSPMSWTIGHIVDNRYLQFDELRLKNTNTQASLDHLYNLYGTHDNGWTFTGDASGRSRKSSASNSDYTLIRNDDRFTDKRVLYDNSNPAIKDRFASCNSLFCNTLGERRYYVSSECTHTIEDLEQRAYKEGTMIPDDGADQGHMSDALGYLVHKHLPLRVYSGSSSIYVG